MWTSPITQVARASKTLFWKGSAYRLLLLESRWGNTLTREVHSGQVRYSCIYSGGQGIKAGPCVGHIVVMGANQKKNKKGQAQSHNLSGDFDAYTPGGEDLAIAPPKTGFPGT